MTAVALLATAFNVSNVHVALAVGCAFEHQGEDLVSDIIDARTFRLQDGREVRLLGIEPIAAPSDPAAIAALATLIGGREVTLQGASDTPDRYGRQPAFVFVGQEATPVQSRLLTDGAALVSAGIADKDCATELYAAEAKARSEKRGVWASKDVIKKRGKSGRYSGEDRAVYRGRGANIVGAAGGGHDIHQFRPALDTGLCCDYFKAHDPTV